MAAKSHEGSGIFANVAVIERINTSGGQAPPVDPSTKTGDEVRVPYTADYLFYSEAP